MTQEQHSSSDQALDPATSPAPPTARAVAAGARQLWVHLEWRCEQSVPAILLLWAHEPDYLGATALQVLDQGQKAFRAVCSAQTAKPITGSHAAGISCSNRQRIAIGRSPS